MMTSKFFQLILPLIMDFFNKSQEYRKDKKTIGTIQHYFIDILIKIMKEYINITRLIEKVKIED